MSVLTAYLFDLLGERFRRQVEQEYAEGWYLGTETVDGITDEVELPMPKYWQAAKALRYPMLFAEVAAQCTVARCEVLLEDWETRLHYDGPRKLMVGTLLLLYGIVHAAMGECRPLVELRMLLCTLMTDFGEGRTMGPRRKDRREASTAPQQAFGDEDFPSRRRQRQLEEEETYDQPAMVGSKAQLDDEAGPDTSFEAWCERRERAKAYRLMRCRKMAKALGVQWVSPPKLDHHANPEGWDRSNWYKAVKFRTLLDGDVGEPDLKSYFQLVHQLKLGTPVPFKYLVTDPRYAVRPCRCHRCRRGRILRAMQNKTVHVHHTEPMPEGYAQSFGYEGRELHHRAPELEWEWDDWSSGHIPFPALNWDRTTHGWIQK